MFVPEFLVLTAAASLVLVQAPVEDALPLITTVGPEAVVATVGERGITRAEQLREFNRLIPLNFYHARVPDTLKAEMERKAMDSVVERTLVAIDAEERKLEVSEEEVRTEFRAALDKAGPEYKDLDEARFAELLEVFRPMTVQRIQIDKNEARFLTTVPPVTEEGLKAAYDALGDTLLSPETARFRTIFLKVEASASTFDANATRDRLEKVRKAISEGYDFDQLAREVSTDIYAGQGGDMGFVTFEDFTMREVGEAAFALADGQLSEVVESMYGYHLLLRLESQPRTRLTLEQAREGLRLELAAKAEATARAAWLADVRRRHPVELLVVMPSLEAAVEGESGAESGPTSRPTGG